MGKKSGKKKGGKKKGEGKRKKKSNLPEMTWKEALLAYDINVKEKAFEEIRYELKVLEDQNLRLKTRNKKLRDEQQTVISNLLKANRALDKALREKTVITKDDVVTQMKSNWNTKKEHQRKILELEEELSKKDLEIETQKDMVKYWEDYRDRGQHEHVKTVHLLEQEIADMEASFSEISGHLEHSLSRTKDEIEKTTADIIDKQKVVATEKAIAKMDKYSRREVVDNDWLRHETEIHRKDTAELFAIVEKLEEENLRLLSDLFQCQVEDLHISKNFFMTQFVENDNLAEKTILEIDLQELAKTKPGGILSLTGFNSKDSTDLHEVRIARPKSAIQKAVEDKLSYLDQLHPSRGDDHGGGEERQDDVDDDDDDGSDADVDRHEAGGFEENDESDPFLEFHHFDDDDFEDYLKLGPLELKLMNVAGQKMPIHRQPTPPADIIKAMEVRPDKWPVTYDMLREALHRTSPRDASATTVTASAALQSHVSVAAK